MSVTCHKCSAEIILETGKDIARSEECTSCYASIRCCLMCEFYDTKSYNECKEPTAERVIDKEKANFCDFFKLAGSRSNDNSKDDLLAKANALFKK